MNWIGLKMRPTQTGDRKNTPGKSSSEVVEHSAEWLRGGRRVKSEPFVIIAMVLIPDPNAKVVDTRFGYDTDMVKTYDEVQKESQ